MRDKIFRNPHDAVPAIVKAWRVVAIQYTHPHECVLFWPGADPFKHFFDALQAIRSFPEVDGPHLIDTQVVANKLEMRVLSREHDFIQSGAARFSMLQEFLARDVKVDAGMLQHALVAGHKYDPVKPAHSPYGEGFARWPLIRVSQEIWRQDLHMLLDEGDRCMGYREPFFRRVALPMWQARAALGKKDFKTAMDAAGRVQAEDWRLAATTWVKGEMDAVEK